MAFVAGLLASAACIGASVAHPTSDQWNEDKLSESAVTASGVDSVATELCAFDSLIFCHCAVCSLMLCCCCACSCMLQPFLCSPVVSAVLSAASEFALLGAHNGLNRSAIKPNDFTAASSID